VTGSRLEEYAAYYLERLDDDESAWFALIEAPVAIVPLLAAAFRGEKDPWRRAQILSAIHQYRSPEILSILEEALDDRAPLVWEEATDGLVSVGSEEALFLVEHASLPPVDDEGTRAEYRAYLEEAMDQIVQALAARDEA